MLIIWENKFYSVLYKKCQNNSSTRSLETTI